jgi:hypothetical protein
MDKEESFCNSTCEDQIGARVIGVHPCGDGIVRSRAG